MTTISLAGREFPVRRFNIKENARAYPLARKLTADGVVDRWLAVLDSALATLQVKEGDERPDAPPALWETNEAELNDMADLVFMACQTGDPALTREDFDALSAPPDALMGAFIQARFLTGAWVNNSETTAPDIDLAAVSEG